MYQSQARNFQLREILLRSEYTRSLLPSIYEERWNYNVPDINLECEESIDNWDDLELGIYSPERNEKILDTSYISENLTNVQDIFNNEFANCEGDESFNCGPVLMLESHLVQNLLEKCKNSNDACLSLLDNGIEGSTESLEMFDEHEISTQEDDDCSNENISQDDSIDSIPMSPRNNEMLQSLPIYDTSPRSSSPSFVDIISNDFTNYRSISPLIIRSPTPLSSRSSSPRMFRSPSPLEFLEHSFSELPIDEATDIMFYDDGHLRRSFSPVLFGSTDQQVPEANTDFQQIVISSAEFPSFNNYVQNRRLNSCQDQVVPEFIEE